MKKEIINHINKLEVEKDITILLATESGSRAWGCPSPDSDYDIRIIFKRKTADYLRINEQPDSLDYFHGELLDINGWDIKKTFRLIKKSNVTPFEWAQSPIIYKEVDNFRQVIFELCKAYFNPKHAINHYRGIAKNSYADITKESNIKLKKLFYVLRPIMAAKWIASKNEIPPMDIPNLISIINNNEIIAKINSLLEIKKDCNEDYIHTLSPLLSDFIKEEINILTDLKVVDKDHEIPNSDQLNKVFRELIK